MPSDFPYLAKSILRYKSPHKTDLSFDKGETIRVTGPSPDDEEWLVGESLDGARTGGFPKEFVEVVGNDLQDVDETTAPAAPAAAEPIDDSTASTAQAAQGASEDRDNSQVAAPVAASTEARPAAAAITDSQPAPPPASSPPLSKAAIAAPAFTPAAASTNEEDPAKLSFKDRLAAFNRTGGAGPPPALKPKPAGAGAPGTWSWKQKQAQAQAQSAAPASEPSAGAAEPLPSAESAASATPAFTANEPPKLATSGDAEGQGKGMSASDAQSSIPKGGSLKERMAALQGAGAFGSPAAKGPPPPVAAKPKVWKRPEAPAGSEDYGAVPMMAMPPPLTRELSGDGSAADDEGAGPAEPGADGEVSTEQQDEEQKEKERRAAIAARMAKLGGRGVMGGGLMGGPRPAAAPPPVKSPSQEVDEPVADATAVSESAAPAAEAPSAAADEVPAPSTTDPSAPPTSIKLPSVPRRAAAPKRKTPARGASQASTASATAPPDSPVIPFVGNETEEPLPETDEQKAQREQLEEAGRGENAALGASAAGISMEPAESIEADTLQHVKPIDEAGEGNEIPIQNLKIEHSGGLEEDDPAVAANAPLDHERVVLFNPAEEEALGGEQDRARDGKDHNDALPPPPPVRSRAPPVSGAALLGLPKDEIELKHEAEESGRAEDEAELQDRDDIPPPPPRITQAHDSAQDSALPASGGIPGLGQPIGAAETPAGPMGGLPPNALSGTDGDGASDEDNDQPPPPPMRQVAEPREHRAVIDESPQAKSAALGKPQGPRPMPPSPSREPSTARPAAAEGLSTASLGEAAPSSEIPAASHGGADVDEEAERRKGIAARMARLGGIKFGHAPPVRRPTGETAREPETDLPSPTGERAVSPPAGPEVASDGPLPPAEEEGDEDADATARRRQATLARLKAGGALGFGMFNHQQPAEETEPDVEETAGVDERVDERGLEQPSASAASIAPAVIDKDIHDAEPSQGNVEQGEDDDVNAPPPPPPTRAPHPRPSLDLGTRGLPSVPETQQVDHDEPRSPRSPATANMPGSPVSLSRQGSMASTRQGRPESPAVRRQSSLRENVPPASPTGSQSAWTSGRRDSNSNLMEEPAVMMMRQNRDDAGDEPPPPPPRTKMTGSPTTGTGVQRGASMRSASSRDDLPSPATRASMSSNRPAFTELKEAAASYGAKVYQAASRLADQGKRQTLGDGDARTLVWQAMTAAGLDANVSFGTLILEQNGQSVVRRMDEPRAGDVVVLADVKLKGKKGLQSYTQAAGSVEIPVFGVCTEFESKKTKVKVWQVEQGHVESASYRLDDLKSGNVKVFRPMP